MLAIFGCGHLCGVSLGSVLDTLHDVGHCAGAVGAENLDSDDIGLFGDTILLTSDGAGAVGAVAVAILISIVGWNGLAPLSATFKVNVVDVGAGIDDVDIDALATICRVKILVECTE